jgi:excisionase family DNA binding protein
MSQSDPINLADLLTVPEAAQALRLSEAFVRKALSQGRIPRFKCGSRTLVSRESLLSLISVSAPKCPQLVP